MLPSNFRLPLRQNFFILKKNGRRIESSVTTTLWLPGKKTNSRFAVVISRRVSNRATSRNKIKRQIYQVIQKILPNFKKPYDILIITKPNIIRVNQNKLREEINNIFNHLTI